LFNEKSLRSARAVSVECKPRVLEQPESILDISSALSWLKILLPHGMERS
jgi:hypothetical protein